jgi:uncharacterized protein YbjT (DUF2867 family)
MSPNSTTKKLILVIGATGAQGFPVIDALLAPGADGQTSPYTIRALTRNTEGKRAQELKAKGVELFQGGRFPISSQRFWLLIYSLQGHSRT